MAKDKMNGSGGLSWQTIIDKGWPVLATVIGSSFVIGVTMWKRLDLLEERLGVHSTVMQDCNDDQDDMLADHEKRIDKNTEAIATLRPSP